MNAQLDRLEAELEKAPPEAQVRYQKEIKAVREKANRLRTTFKKVETGDKGSWDDLKKGAGNTWSAFKKSFVKAKAEFKKGYKEGLDE